MSVKFGLIGGGVMGEALLSRLINLSIYEPSEIIVSEPQPLRQNFLAQEYRVAVTSDNSQVFTTSEEVVFLAIKPQVFSALTQEIFSSIDRSHSPLVVSILAGVSLSQ